MKRVIKNNYKIIVGIIIGLVISVSGVYAATAIIQAVEVSYKNNEKYTTKNNVQDSIDELYERSGMHKEIWIDQILNGADPVLKDDLIPVDIKSDGTVYYANLYTEWYNYSEKRWANAIILNDDAKTKYTTGQKIEESDIKGYFVWIPRYQYKVWNMGEYSSTMSLGDLKNDKDNATNDTALWKITGNNTRIIDIEFESKTAPKTTASKVDDYQTHPAFTLGKKELSGIWVGKFETGGIIDSPIVKPGVLSLRNQTVKKFFDAGKNFSSTLDSHMMKNTEWGAVAYLSHSKYGIGNEVNINNASDFKTGYSAAPNTNQSTIPSESDASNNSSKTQLWNTTTGYLASTTGNISGVYDISGGVWEYMAACIEETPGNASGFDAETLAKEMSAGYIDKYPKDSDLTSYNKRILGDATGELGPFYNYLEGNRTSYNRSSWYGDYAKFVDSTVPWFGRGGNFNDGVLTGQFNFNSVTGDAIGTSGFRLVLSPTK